MSDNSSASEQLKPVDLARSAIANTAIGAVGGGIGAAAISATLPVVLPVMLAGGVAAYLLTNRMPAQ